MLPHFHVVSYSQPERANLNALISITAAEYDEIIANYSPAALRYLDDDDGEIVRVGSSLELAQRLDDPIPAFPRIQHRSRRAFWEPPENMASYSSPRLVQQCHSFDINNCNITFAIWLFLEERTRLSLLSLEIPFDDIVGGFGHSLSVSPRKNLFVHNRDPQSMDSAYRRVERAVERWQEPSRGSKATVASFPQNPLDARGEYKA